MAIMDVSERETNLGVSIMPYCLVKAYYENQRSRKMRRT